MDKENEKGKLVIVSGPSGVGKSTICREVIKRLDDAHLSVSATTRPKGRSEIDGEDYYFISREDFKQRLEKEMFLEHAEVFDNLYGTPKDKVDEALADGLTVVLEIDVQGGEQVKELYPDAVMIFILPPSPKDLSERMNGRDRGEDEEAAKLRIQVASAEIAAAWQHYKNMVINENLEHAVDEVMQIIEQSSGDQ